MWNSTSGVLRTTSTRSCSDYAPSQGSSGFSTTNVNYYVPAGFREDVAGSAVTVNIDPAGNCDALGSRFVRVEARLWDGTGSVDAYLEQQGGGVIPGTVTTVDPSGFYRPAYSPMKNVAGLTVRGCGTFRYAGQNAVRCTDWVTVPF